MTWARMSSVGYSTEYEIYLTDQNGVQIVTNELSLIILKEIRYHEISPSEIASAIGIPKSTVQANIAKLLSSGIVSQEQSINDARSVVYHISANLLFSSDADIEWQIYARLASVIRILKSGRCTSREDMSLYGVSLTESGLNIVQGLFSIGASLTSKGRMFENWEKLVENVKEVCAERGYSVKINTDEGIELELESDEDNLADIPMIVVPMLGAIINQSTRLLGKNLVQDISLSVNKGGRLVRMRVRQYDGQPYDEHHVKSNSIANYKVSEPFSIYSIKGKATLFTNVTMMSILHNLSERDLSVNDLEEITGVPKATLYASIKKLLDLGAIEIDENSGSPKNYVLLADPILYSKDSVESNTERLFEIIDLFHEGKMDYYTAVISYAMEAIGCMGLHFEKMFVRSGRSTARSFLQLFPNIEPEKLIDVACNMVSVPDRAEVVSHIPLKIRVILSKETIWESWPADFIKGFVHEGLFQLLGEEYKVSVETVQEVAPGKYEVLDF